MEDKVLMNVMEKIMMIFHHSIMGMELLMLKRLFKKLLEEEFNKNNIAI